MKRSPGYGEKRQSSKRSDDESETTNSGYATSLSDSTSRTSERSLAETTAPGCSTPNKTRSFSTEQYHIQRALDETNTNREDVPEEVLDVIGDGGEPLDISVQRAFEDKMDTRFDQVRVHTGPNAAEAADAIDAKAFTCGNDIVFNAGEYDPESTDGQFLLAHELAHVRQQTDAPLSMMPKSDADLEIDPDPKLEREADQAAEQALEGEGALTINRLGAEVQIQRVEKTRREFLQGEMSADEVVAGIEDAELDLTDLDFDPDNIRDAYKFAEHTVTVGATTGIVQTLMTQYDLSQPEAIAVSLAVGGGIHVSKDRLHRNDYYIIYEVGKALGVEDRVRALFERMDIELDVGRDESTGDVDMDQEYEQ